MCPTAADPKPFKGFTDCRIFDPVLLQIPRVRNAFRHLGCGTGSEREARLPGDYMRLFEEFRDSSG